MRMDTVLNFSYGSNMLRQRITQRVPSARAVGTAVLRGHVLRWHKAGQDGSAKCDVVPTGSPDDKVHGVVYELLVSEKHLLDAAEGLGHGYDEKQIDLEADGGMQAAWTYYATSLDAALLPFSWYKALVVAGALEHGLPPAYVRQLQSVAATDDPESERAQRHWVLTSGSAPALPSGDNRYRSSTPPPAAQGGAEP